MRWIAVLVGLFLIGSAASQPLPPQAIHRFGSSRFCVEESVTSLALSPDGKWLGASDREGKAYLWETESGKIRIQASQLFGQNVAFSPDGRWFAQTSGIFQFHDLQHDKVKKNLLIDAVSALAYTVDSKKIVAATGPSDDLPIFNVEGGGGIEDYLPRPDDKTILSSIAYSSDGKHIAGAGMVMQSDEEKDKPIARFVVWDASTRKLERKFDLAARDVSRLRILPDNTTMIAQVGGRLMAWDLRTGERIAKITDDVGSAYALDSAGKVLATTDGPKVIDFHSKKVLHEFESPIPLYHIAISGNGKILAAAGRVSGGSPRILLWDLTTGKELPIPDGHRHFVDAVAFSHDGKSIATASHVEGSARVWDAKNGKMLHALNIDSLAAKKSGGPRSRRTLQDALAFAVGRPELFVSGQRWDLVKGLPIALKADDDFAFDQTNSKRAVLTYDARYAASFLHDGRIEFWHPAKAKSISRIDPRGEQGPGEWHALAFAPDGKRAITGRWFAPIRPNGDDTIHPTLVLWDAQAGKKIRGLRSSPVPVVRTMFAPDGETLAVISYPSRLELWHLPTGRRLREMNLTEIDDRERPFVMPAVAFSPNGQWIAFASGRGEIAILETITGKEMLKLRGHDGMIASVAFSPDSQRLLTGGRDTTAIVWSVVPSKSPRPDHWQDAEKLWLDLGGATENAYRIVWALAGDPERAVEVLSKRLRPDAGATEKEIRELIANLASEKFPQREAAIVRLKQIGVRSLPMLEKGLKDAPNLETGRRIRGLLETVETALTPESLRDIRGLLILEMIATPEARRLLGEIAGGDPDAAKTRMARAALARLGG